MLTEAAGSVGRMHGKNYLAVQHARLTTRRGMSRAQIAVAHSILVTAYYMLQRDEPYQDLGPDWLATPQRGSPHPPAGRPAGEARPHRDHRPRRLTRRRDNYIVGLRPTALTRALGQVIHGSVWAGELGAALG